MDVNSLMYMSNVK